MKGLLKFITCGSVDDGKSTLIGHILYDSKLLYADQERALELDSRAGSRGGKMDYSLLLDGLTEEREQGITIDVAYRYFTTDKRSFIVADTPGHEEYTRNMAVGASFAELAVILVDASQGVLVQTKRHARICALMGIRSFVFALNKMDLVGYREKTYQRIAADIRALAEDLGLEKVQIIPVSATEGDNVTKRSARMEWYDGPALLPYLEKIEIDEADAEEGFYLPVQRVCRPDHTFRGFQGQIEAGTVRVGDELEVLPSREHARVKSIYAAGVPAESAQKGQPVTIALDREVDVSRGCVLSRGADAKVVTALTATLLWMDEDALENGKNFFVKIGTRLIPGLVTEIVTVMDVNTGGKREAAALHKNEIAECRIALSDQIVADTFARHRTLGELILIDRVTFHTSACGVVTALVEKELEDVRLRNEYLRRALKGQRPAAAVFVEGEDPVTRGQLRDIERRLASHYGRHVYTYEPAPGEDYETVTRYLLRAGLIVLLLLSAEQAERLAPGNPAFLRGWKRLLSENGSSADPSGDSLAADASAGAADTNRIARLIRDRTVFRDAESEYGEYI